MHFKLSQEVSPSGTYTMMLVSFSDKGFPFGNASLGEIKLVATEKGFEILKDTCTTTAKARLTAESISKTFEFSPRDVVTLSCSVVNNTASMITVDPLFEVKEGSAFGIFVLDWCNPVQILVNH